MIIVPIASIEVRKRQRSELEPARLAELKDEIYKVGLLHPPVCWKDGEKWILTVGERRFNAVQLAHKENLPVYHNNERVPEGFIPISLLSDFLDDIGRFEAELSENIARVDLEWQDRVRAFADLHEMRSKINPKQSLAETGAEVMKHSPTLSSPKAAERAVSQSVILAKHLGNDKIAKARNASEALSLVYKLEEEKALAAVARRQVAASPQSLEVRVLHADLISTLPKLDADQFDLICADPPYGIGASSGGFRGRTVHHHNYEDTPENARRIAQTLLIEGWRITKARANIFIFCDIDMFDFLKQTAANMGWSPFRRPLIWRKSESEGMAPWGGSGPRITTEFIFYATKGRRGMHVSPIDCFDVKRVPRNERIHAAEKPVELFDKLLGCTTLPGDYVLDPCCGSGASGVACRESKRRYLGIEIDDDYFNTAMANVHGKTTTS